MERRSKVSLKEAFLLHKRGFLIFGKQCPKAFLSRAVYAVIKALVPYIEIYLSALLINELAGERDIGQIKFLVMAVLVSGLLLSFLSESIKRWQQYENAALWQNRERVYIEKMLDMDFVDIDSQHTHDLYEQIRQNENWGGWGIYKIPEYFETGLRSVISIIGALSLTASLFVLKVPEEAGVLTMLNHPLSIAVILGLMFGTSILASVCSAKAGEYYTECAEEARFGNRVFGFFGFVMADIKRAVDMRIYNQQDISLSYFTKYDSFGIGSRIKQLERGRIGVLRALSSVISASFQGFIYAFVCLKAWAGAFGVGSVTQYIGAITALAAGVKGLFQTLGNMKSNAVFLKTTFDFLDIPNNMYQGSLTVEKRSDCKYEIEFRNVSFRYPASDIWALKNVSFKFCVGERLAIVGENGSGKTTFIKLLCRLYDPTEGQILLNGIDIRKYNYKEYMSVFAVVFQDFQILSYGLGENIAAGQSYDEKKAEKCLKEAGFGERLQKLPNGLATNLYKDFDDKGVEISGGEAQKIALARALYKEAPFIILDEPTAALDPVAEQEVYEKFNEIVGNKTAVYISHRLSSCRFCDVIAVFDRGSVVQRGSHEELVRVREGKYHKLWYAQAQYYTEG